MSTVAFIEGMMAAGFTTEEAIKAARVFEQVQSEVFEQPAAQAPTKAAERTRRWREKRHQPSQTVTGDACDVTTVTVTPSPSLSPSPQTPQPPTHPREYNTPLPPKDRQRRKPETPLPEACPSAELIGAMQAEAREAGANADMAFEARQFRDWWLSKDGRNRDWDACWRTWARKRIASAPKTAVASLAQRQAQALPADERWRRWIREYRQNRYWPKDDAGPAPGAPGCRVPQAILAEFGFSPAAANDTPKPDLFEGGAAA